MRLWHPSKSTPHALLAYGVRGGVGQREPTIFHTSVVELLGFAALALPNLHLHSGFIYQTSVKYIFRSQQPQTILISSFSECGSGLFHHQGF